MQNTIRTALPPSESEPVLDDPLELCNINEPSFIATAGLDRLGCSSYEQAYKKIKDSVGPQTLNRFIKKRTGPGKVILDDEIDYQILIHAIIGCQAGREMIQNAVCEKLMQVQSNAKRRAVLSVLIERQILEYWLYHRDEYNEQAVGNSRIKSEIIDSFIRPHPYLSTFILYDSSSQSFRPPFPDYVSTDFISLTNALLFDADYYFQYGPDKQLEHAAGAWAMASLYRSRMLWCAYSTMTERDLLGEGVRAVGLTREPQLARHDVLRLMNHQFLVQTYFSGGDYQTAAWLGSNTKPMIEALGQAKILDAITVARNHAIAVLQRLEEDIAPISASLEIEEFVKNWPSAINRVVRQIDALPEYFEQDAETDTLSQSLEYLVASWLDPLEDSLDELETLHNDATFVESTHYTKMVERMEATQAIAERLEQWKADHEASDLITPKLPAISAPKSPEKADATDEPPQGDEPSTEYESVSSQPQGWSEEDLSQVLDDNERLKSERNALSAQVQNLQDAINQPERTGVIDTKALQTAFAEHTGAPSRLSALRLLEALYPDRLRVLDSAWESLSEVGEGISANTITNRLTPLVTTALDAFRAGTRHIEINDLIAGEIKFNESDTVVKNERLRRLRDFRDGARTHTMYWHFSLDHGHRVYFDYSENESRILIGYLGKHLPSARAKTV